MQDPESHSEHTRRDTQRANGRTFKRRSFMAPPRSEVEAEMDEETYHHEGIANEHFVDELPRDDAPAESGGLPDGYEETEVVICDRATNTAVGGEILFKPSA